MSNTVQIGQSLLDKAIELTGSVDNAFAISVANGMSVTDDLEVGSEIERVGLIFTSVAALFGNTACALATAYSPKAEEAIPEGIGFWTIGSTFIIS